MIRKGISVLLGGLLAAGVICLPVTTGMPEILPTRLSGAGGYPVRIALPPSPADIVPLVPEELEEQVAEGPQAGEAAEELLPDADDETSLAAAQTEEALTGTAAQRGVLLSLKYDLSDPSTLNEDNAAAAEVEIAKQVRVNGTDVGQATIRVTSGSTLLIARDEVVSLLETAGQTEMAKALTAEAAASGRFVSFEELRQRGMEVRYDAATDRIALSS